MTKTEFIEEVSAFVQDMHTVEFYYKEGLRGCSIRAFGEERRFLAIAPTIEEAFEGAADKLRVWLASGCK